MTKIGIIAGDGNLPLYIGKSLLSKNYDVTFLSLNNKNNKFYNNHHIVNLDILSIKKMFRNNKFKHCDIFMLDAFQIVILVFACAMFFSLKIHFKISKLILFLA